MGRPSASSASGSCSLTTPFSQDSRPSACYAPYSLDTFIPTINNSSNITKQYPRIIHNSPPFAARFHQWPTVQIRLSLLALGSEVLQLR